MGLSLESDSDMLNRSADHGVCDACERAGQIVLAVGEAWGLVLRGVVRLETAPSFMEGTELHGDAGTDPYQRRECAFVEC